MSDASETVSAQAVRDFLFKKWQSEREDERREREYLKWRIQQITGGRQFVIENPAELLKALEKHCKPERTL